jgi:hypothetical protein
MDYYSAIKKNEIFIHRKMDETGDHSVEQNKRRYKSKILYIYMCNPELRR